MKKTQFSVIVPVFKAEKYLKECLDSLINQSFKDFELILVDDGSPDNCPEICDEYAEKYDFIKVIHKANGGSISARKAGAEVAVGEYIVYVDSDDWVSSDFLKVIYDAISETGADIVSMGYAEVRGDKTLIRGQNIESGYYDKGKLISEIYPRMISKKPYFTFGVFPSLCLKSIRRELILDLQENIPLEVNIGDDGALVYAALLKADSLNVIDKAEYYYRMNDTSMTHSFNPKMIDRIIALFGYYDTDFDKSLYNLDKQIKEYTAFLTMQVIFNELKAKDDIKMIRDRLYAYLKSKNIWKCWKGVKLPIKQKITLHAVLRKNLWLLKKLQAMLNRGIS